jgi:putative ABC transport system permease protein
LITEETARKYFDDEDPIGKVVSADGRYYGGNYKITGVLKAIPPNSTIRFDFLSSTVRQEITLLAWDHWQPDTAWRPVQTYVVLPKGYSPEVLEHKLPNLIARYMGEEVRKYNSYHLQPLSRIHLYSDVDFGLPGEGDIVYIYIFSAITFFILIIACINFMNLSTARAAKRMREVGLRKVVGASRAQLVRQFLGESIFLSYLALLLALGIVEVSLPAFNQFAEKQLMLDFGNRQMFLGLLGIGILVGIFVGSYPAFFLSAFHPVEVLKGTLKAGPRSAQFLRRGLVIFQFSISIFLIVVTAVIYNQLTYINSKKLGFNKEHVVVLPIFNADRSLTGRYETVKQVFLQHPGVLKASASNSTVGWGGAFQTVRPEGIQGDAWQMWIIGADESFLDTYEIELLKG